MDRVAVFVDAGYLYAGGAKSVSGNDETKRPDIALNIALAISYLVKQAEAISQLKLLRIYWYDGARGSGSLTTDHQILASTDNVKLRLGVINGFGQQKGVDGKIITDLAELSRNRAFTDAVLLGGDEDLRLGVELAQQYGARVHLLTIEGSSFSPSLHREADTMTVLPASEITQFLTVRVAAPAAQHQLSNPPSDSRKATQSLKDDVLPTVLPRLAADVQENEAETLHAAFDRVIQVYLADLSPEDRVSLVAALKTGTGVPSEHDGRLLALSRNALNRSLTQPEKAQLRRALKQHLNI